VQILLLGLPIVGMLASFAMSGKQLSTYVWKSTEGRPLRRATSMCIAAMLGALLVISWTAPGANYRPIQPGERGTVQAGAVDTVPAPLRQAIPRSFTNPVPLPDVSPAPSAAGASPSPGASPSSEASPSASPSESSSASPSESPSAEPSPSPS
jgi:putative peptide zinc metalloprotease protein